MGGYVSSIAVDNDAERALITHIQSVAIEFAKANAKAIVLAARTTSQLEEVRDQILRVSSKTQVHVQSVDVGDETAVKSLYDAAQSKFGGVDVVVSNAGAQAEFGKLLPDTDTESWWIDWVRLSPTHYHPLISLSTET